MRAYTILAQNLPYSNPTPKSAQTVYLLSSPLVGPGSVQVETLSRPSRFACRTRSPVRSLAYFYDDRYRYLIILDISSCSKIMNSINSDNHYHCLCFHVIDYQYSHFLLLSLTIIISSITKLLSLLLFFETAIIHNLYCSHGHYYEYHDSCFDLLLPSLSW